MSEATLMGRSRNEWHRHIDELFDMASEGEEIPETVLLYAWPRTITEQDKAWATSKVNGIEVAPTDPRT